MSEKNTLVLVEGEDEDYKLLDKAFKCFLPSENRKIIPYATNIYSLCRKLDATSEDWEDLDFLQVLKEYEKDSEKKHIFDIRFTDILLVFDFDSQDTYYDAQNLRRMMSFFSESTEHGRLYINYPMVESFFHIKAFNDNDTEQYMKRIALQDELLVKGQYKNRVGRESCLRDLEKYDKEKMRYVLLLNLRKVRELSGNTVEDLRIALTDILELEISHYARRKFVDVLNTCILFVYEYNSRDIT